jgi:hypothetical protein
MSAVERFVRWLSLVAGIGLALFAGQGLGERFTLGEASLIFAVAAGLFLYGAPPPLWGQKGQAGALAAASLFPPGAQRNVQGVILALILAGAGGMLLWGEMGSLPGLLLWGASMGLLLASVWRLNQAPHQEQATPRKRWGFLAEMALLGIILAVALGVRLWQWEFFPNGLQSDEANNAMEALKWLSGAAYSPYSEANEGQATLFTYLIALSFSVLGADLFAIRLVPILVGTATVAAFYWLTRTLFTPLAALTGTALLAVARWHITFSRIIYELILVPLAAIWLFGYLYRGLRDSRPRDFVLAGLALAVGLNSYTGFRTLPFALALFFLYWLITHRQRIGVALQGGVLFGLAAGIGLIPLGIYTLQRPDVVMIRTRSLNIFGEIDAAGSLEPLWLNLRNYLMMFNMKGDPVAINNLPGEPMLFGLVAALFLLGIVYALRYLNHPLLFLALAWILGALPAGIFSVTLESPSSRRVIAMIPVIFLLVTVVIDAFWRGSLRTWFGWRRYVWMAAVVAFVGVVGQAELHTFFQRQIVNPGVRMAFSPVDSSIGRYLADLEQPSQIFLDQNYRGHSSIRFLANEPEYTVLDPSLHLPLETLYDQDVIYVLSPAQQQLRFLYEYYYPGGEWTPHLDPYGGVMFYTFGLTPQVQQASMGLTAHLYPGSRWDEAPVARFAVPGLTLPEQDLADLLPGDEAFGLAWQGSLRTPTHGEYSLTVEADGPVSLTLDGELLLSVEGGRQSGSRFLVSGFHDLRLTAELLPGQAPPRLWWSGPVAEAALPQAALYTFDAPDFGLVGTYYTNPDWLGEPYSVQHDVVIASTDALPSPYSILWQGNLRVDAGGTYRFGTNSDDGSWLYINGELVVDNGGRHGAIYRESEPVDLPPGIHDIEIHYFQDGGSHKLELFWTPPGFGRELIPPDRLLPAYAPTN